MLQDFRENLRGTAVFIVILISIPFALVGIDQIFTGGSSLESELSVNGEEISKFEVDQALALHKQSLLEQYESLDPAMLNDELLRGPIKYRLIREKVMSQHGHTVGLGLDDKIYRDMIRNIELFQVNGQFNMETFEYALRQRGHTQKSYYDSVKDSLLISQMAAAIAVTSIITDEEIVSAAALLEQKRNYYYLTIPVEGLRESLFVAESEILNYYQNNSPQFKTEERVVLDFLELTVAGLMSEVSVDETMVKERFAILATKNTDTARNRVRHILFASESDIENEKKLAQVQTRLAEGESFADLALELSDDPGSAEQGGDLGYVDLTTLPGAFAETVAELEEGDVSGPVITESGIHLIQLVDRHAVEPPQYQLEVGEIREQLLKQLAEQLLPEKIDELREMSYNAESLLEVGDELGLSLQTTSSFSRDGGEGISAFPAVIRAAFGEEVLVDGHASDVIELSSSRMVVVKLRESIPARLKLMSEVRESIELQLKTEAAQQLVKERGDKILALVEAGGRVEDLAVEEGLPWQVSIDTGRFGGLVDEEVRRYVFELAGQSILPHASGFTKTNGEYVIVSLTNITPGRLDKFSTSQRENLRDTMRRNYAQQEYRSYEASLVAAADVEGFAGQ